jgi:hypothetical protein
MSIYINGYAVGGIISAEFIALTAAIHNGTYRYSLCGVDPAMQYQQWAGAAVELKGFASGLFADTDYKLTETFLAGLSRQTAGVLYLCCYEGIKSFGCVYYLNGKKVLDRLTVDGNNITDTVKDNEFEGHSTAALIEQLFARLTGGTLQEAVNKKGALFYYEKSS